MLEYLITLVFLLELMITSTTVDPTKENLYKWKEDLTPAFVSLGYAPIKDISITWESISARGATKSPFHQSIHDWCGPVIGIQTTYRYDHTPTYGTPEVVWVLAHELAHVYQGAECSMWYSERKANAAALAALFSGKDELYWQAGIWMLRELAIVRAVDESCKQKEDYHLWLNKLSDQTLEIYGNIKCWQVSGYREYSVALDEIIDSDGVVRGIDVGVVRDILMVAEDQ